MSNNDVIADSACLIALERINRLEILPELFDSISIPLEVAREFGITLPWLEITSVSDQALVSTLKLLVDDGEAEAIALACETQQKVILDDQQARKVARRLKVQIIGTVGIFIQAKQQGIIENIQPLLNDLENCGFYLSKSLKQEALKIVDE